MVLSEIPEAEPTQGAASPVPFPSLLQQGPAELDRGLNGLGQRHRGISFSDHERS